MRHHLGVRAREHGATLTGNLVLLNYARNKEILGERRTNVKIHTIRLIAKIEISRKVFLSLTGFLSRPRRGIETEDPAGEETSHPRARLPHPFVGQASKFLMLGLGASVFNRITFPRCTPELTGVPSVIGWLDTLHTQSMKQKYTKRYS